MSPRSEAGYTLVELLVAMGIGLVVVTGAFTLIGSAFPLASSTQERVDATQRGRVALDQMLTQLRSQVCIDSNQPPIYDAKDNAVTFHASLGNETSAPQRRTLTFAGGTITEQVVQGTGTNPVWSFTGTPTTRSLATGLAQQGTTPVFRYYAYTTAAPYEPTRLLDPAGTASLTAAELKQVVRVDVAFLSNPQRAGARAQPVPFQGSVQTRTADPMSPAAGPNCR
jgi:prepilin-type N-terminal cleavage/methylation domain-containing protein